MASRPKGYGLTGEVNRKILGKYDVALEQQAREWIEAVTGDRLDPNADPSVPLGMDDFQLALKDGKILCKLISTISPGNAIKPNESKMAFKQMENTGRFLDACVAIGMNKADLFQTADLFEKTNMVQVVNAIFALGRKAQKIGYDGPTLGVKEADYNPRNFSDEQLNAGQGVIGLQMGTNKGASQSGMSFGRARSINEHGQNGDY